MDKTVATAQEAATTVVGGVLPKWRCGMAESESEVVDRAASGSDDVGRVFRLSRSNDLEADSCGGQ